MKASLYRKIKKNHSLGDPSINLTPLIDVVFVILVMFIIIAPLLELDEVQLAKGSELDSTAFQSESSLIRIHVKSDDTIFINNESVPVERLKKRLTEAKDKLPGQRPQVFHDKRATFGIYQTLKNTLEEVGYTDMDIILQPS